MSLKGKVIAQIALDCGLLYGMLFSMMSCTQPRTDDDDGGILTVNLENRTFEKIMYGIYGTLQPVNAARFPEMAKERGMANVPNMSSQRVYLLKRKQSLWSTLQQAA